METAKSFADDVRRYLDDEPIQSPPLATVFGWCVSSVVDQHLSWFLPGQCPAVDDQGAIYQGSISTAN